MAVQLQIWRIENFEKVEVDPAHHGKFYTGDCYLVMATVTKNDVEFQDIYMWQGKEASQDERGACAMLCVMLDDEYGGKPIQHREMQGYESSKFMSYFKPAIQYLEGGVASGFTHAEINDYSEIKRLLWVRGRQQVRVDEMPFEWASLNKSDCFIIDMGNEIYQWNGPNVNPFEKMKCAKFANSIQDDERAGKVSLEYLDSEMKMLYKFFGDLDGDLAEGAPEEVTTRRGRTMAGDTEVKLFKVSDADGEMTCEEISNKLPFHQDMLSGSDVHIITNGEQIYVWKGREASQEEKKSAFTFAEKFITENGLPPQTQVTVVAQYGEPVLFQSFFDDWQDEWAQEGLGDVWSINKIAKIERIDFDVSTLAERPDLAAKYQLPDDGTGEVKVYRVEDAGKVEAECDGQLYGGDCYIITYSSDSCQLVYYWIGSDASQDEIGAVAILAIETDNEEFDGNATQIRVTEGHEPPHMLLLFQEKPLIVNLGGTSREGGQTEPADKRLFHVRAGVLGRSRAVETPCEAKYLNSNDAFLLVTPDGNFLWMGKGASEHESSSCQLVAATLGVDVGTEVQEGEEPDEFWEHLGGQARYRTSPELLAKNKFPLRLFECCDASGNFVVDEVLGDIRKEDLNENNVMLLDAWTTLFVWIGDGASENEKTQAVETAKKYLDLEPGVRSSETVPVICIKQGAEPLSFKGFFQDW